MKEMKNIIVPIQGTDILPASDADTITNTKVEALSERESCCLG